MVANERPGRSPDDVCADRSESAHLDLRLIPGEVEAEELPIFVIRGSRDTLRFVAELLIAVADTPTLPARFHISPNAAGRFHFSAAAEAGLYIECTDQVERTSASGQANSA